MTPERFYVHLLDGRRVEPLELEILQTMADCGEIGPKARLKRESDGRRFYAKQKLRFNVQEERLATVSDKSSGRQVAAKNVGTASWEERDASSWPLDFDDFPPLWFDGELGKENASAFDGASEEASVSPKTERNDEKRLLETTGERRSPADVSTKRGNVGDGVAETVKKEPKSATLEERPSASENNLNQPTERGERKFGAVKFLLRLAFGGGLTAVCVMGAITAWPFCEAFMGVSFIIGFLGVPVMLVLMFEGCFDAKTNPIDEKEEEAKPSVSKCCVAEKNSEKTVEEPGDRATNGADDETKTGAASRRGAWAALIGVALIGVAVASVATDSTWELCAGAGGLGALICLAFAVGELISSLILRD